MVNGNDKGSATDFPSDEGSRFSASPWLLIHSCRETTPRKTVEQQPTRDVGGTGGEGLVNKAQDRLHKVAIFETTTTTAGEFYVLFVFRPRLPFPFRAVEPVVTSAGRDA